MQGLKEKQFKYTAFTCPETVIKTIILQISRFHSSSTFLLSFCFHQLSDPQLSFYYNILDQFSRLLLTRLIFDLNLSQKTRTFCVVHVALLRKIPDRGSSGVCNSKVFNLNHT